MGHVPHDVEVVVDVKIVFRVGNRSFVYPRKVSVEFRVGAGDSMLFRTSHSMRSFPFTLRQSLVTHRGIESPNPRRATECTYMKKIVLHVPVICHFADLRIAAIHNYRILVAGSIPVLPLAGDASCPEGISTYNIRRQMLPVGETYLVSLKPCCRRVKTVAFQEKSCP